MLPCYLLVSLVGRVPHRVLYRVIEPAVQVFAQSQRPCVEDQPAIRVRHSLPECSLRIRLFLCRDVTPLAIHPVRPTVSDDLALFVLARVDRPRTSGPFEQLYAAQLAVSGRVFPLFTSC